LASSCYILSQAYRREAKISVFTRVNVQMEKALSAFPYNDLPMSEEVREQVNCSLLALSILYHQSRLLIIHFFLDNYS
jgi:hypothetical protein